MKKTILIALSALCAITSYPEEKADARIYAKAEFIRFKKDAQICGDDNEVPCYVSVPDKFKNRKITALPIQSPDPIEFRVEKAGLVTIVVNENMAQKLVPQGWVKVDTGSFRTNNKTNTIVIMQKHHEVGEYSIPNQGWYGVHLLK